MRKSGLVAARPLIDSANRRAGRALFSRQVTAENQQAIGLYVLVGLYYLISTYLYV